MHLTRGDISELFTRELGSAPTDNPEDLTMIARRVLRQKYIQADVGLTGANFAIAETGMISITENEGNARLTAALPKTLITLLGFEKILPRLEDLALFLPMLATAGTGQPLTCYNSLYGGPRRRGSRMARMSIMSYCWTIIAPNCLPMRKRDALHCIRCGACLNVCPIFRNVGGHTYGTTYSGPIGSVITPHLRGLQDWKHLSSASSLCGACTETCPVKINLHHHLLQNRRNAAAQQPSWSERLLFKLFAAVVNCRHGIGWRPKQDDCCNECIRWFAGVASIRHGPGRKRATWRRSHHAPLRNIGARKRRRPSQWPGMSEQAKSLRGFRKL